MKRKFISIVLILTLLLSFVLATATPVSAAGAPAIDGTISDGEWDGALEIDVASSMGTVKVLASEEYLYVLLDVVDSTDARTQYVNERGNDQVSANINPTAGVGTWGFPYDLIFETSALSGGAYLPDDGGHHQLPWYPKVNSGTSADGWATRWFPDDAQETLPVELESATVYSSGKRVTEWKLPLVSTAGATLEVGGAIDVGDGNSYVYPVGLDWNDPATFAEYSLMVENENTGIFYPTIQSAVDGASADDVLAAYPGVYDEDVTINIGLTLGSVVEHEAVVEGTIVIDADGVTVDGFSIQDFSQIPVPDWSAIYIQSGTNVSVSNNIIDGNAIDPVANLTVGIHTLYGGSAEAALTGNVITNVRLGIYNQGAQMLITENSIDGAAWCGIGVDTSLGTTILENIIINNKVGIEVFQENVVAHFNKICGNTEFGIWSLGAYVDAICNWWGAADGPGPVGSGSGDNVSDYVDYNPWLSKPWFQISKAKIEFAKYKAKVKGILSFNDAPCGGVESSNPVTVTVGPVSSDSFTMVAKDGKWEYKGAGPISKMKIDWTKGVFEFSMAANFSGLTNPVTISLRVGSRYGEQTVTMAEKDGKWEYKPPKPPK